MSDTASFSAMASALEELSDLNQLEARGTLRLALKNAGLSASDVTRTQMRVVLEKRMADELDARGVGESKDLVRDLLAELDRLPEESDRRANPEASLRRLWGEKD